MPCPKEVVVVPTRRLKNSRVLSPFVSLLIALSFVLVAAPAHADKTDKLSGDIIVSEKRFPSRFDSDDEMYKYMRKVNTHELVVSGDDDWEFEYMAFLPKPIAVLQAAVSFYDVTVPGTQKLIDTRIFYPADRRDKIISGGARLQKGKFSKDRKYLMVFSRGYGQRALAQTKIVLRRK